MKTHKYLINIANFIFLAGLTQGCILGEDDIPDESSSTPDTMKAPDMSAGPDLGPANHNACVGEDCPPDNSAPCSGETSPDDCVIEPTCGDGALLGSEECDDGNVKDGDGCDASCAIEDGWRCDVLAEPSDCETFCGDDIVTGDESCDDGNMEDGDGCDASCAVEAGYTCDDASCVTRCGDGIVAGNEACDDANNVSDDGCTTDCTIEPGFVCDGDPSVCMPGCGDDVKGEFEECDDGNLIAGDGCSARCTIDDPCVDEASGPFVINNVDKLQCMNKHLSATYVIAPGEYALPSDFNSIGSNSDPFTGSLRRVPGTTEAVRITGLTSTGESNIGLFRRLSGATIANLQIIAPSINISPTTTAPVGALAAGCDTSSITDIIVTAPMISGRNRVGGVIGASVGCNVRDVIVDATSAPGELRGNKNVGGVIGKAENTTSVIDVQLEGELTVSASEENAGGVAGKLERGSLSTVTTATLADLTVSAGTNAGGLLGEADEATISDSTLAATGAVTVTASTTNGGGAVGLLVSGGLERVITSAHVNGGDNIGGVAGRLDGAIINNTHTRGGTSSVLSISGSSNVGGFVGELVNTSLEGTDSSLLQVEGVSVNGNENVGGFIGHGLFEQGQLTLSKLDVAAAQVLGDANIGGFAGRVHITEPITFTGNSVQAHVTGRVARAGGWFGELQVAEATATQNIGSTTSSIGFKGIVEGEDKVGGIVGELTGAATFYAELRGDAGQPIDIKGSSNVGGFIGENHNTSSFETRITSGARFEGIVSGERNVGGFIGRQDGKAIVRGAVITGSSTSVSGAHRVGGIIGEAIGASSADTGKIELIGVEVNGIEINGDSSVIDERATATGGMIGYASGDVHIQGRANAVCNVYANVSGEDRVGGLIGEAHSSGSGGTSPKVTMCQIGTQNSGSMHTISGVNRVGGAIGFGENTEGTAIIVNNVAVTFDGSRSIDCTAANPCERFGGLVGHATGNLLHWSGSRVINSDVTATAQAQVGGAFGVAYCNESSTANSCGTHSIPQINNVAVNNTSVRGASVVGGLIGEGSGRLFVQNSDTNLATAVTCSNGDCGGFAGLITNRSRLSGIVSAARLSCANSTCSSSPAPGAFPERAPGMGGCVGALSASKLISGSCTGSVIVSGPTSFPMYTGGAVGIMRSDSGAETLVEKTHATGIVNVSSIQTGLPMHSGGLVGYAEPATKISECWASGDVSVNANSAPNGVSGDGAAGGIIGMLVGGTVTDSWANGRVTGAGDVGGIAGNISYNTTSWATYFGSIQANTLPAAIIRCFASSELIQAQGGEHAGGIVGQAAISAFTNYTLTGNLSTTTPITGSGGTGGLIGYLSGAPLTSTASITGNVSVDHACIGRPNFIPTSACEQVATFPVNTSAAPFTSWDLTNIWMFSLSPTPSLTLRNNP